MNQNEMFLVVSSGVDEACLLCEHPFGGARMAEGMCVCLNVMYCTRALFILFTLCRSGQPFFTEQVHFSDKSCPEATAAAAKYHTPGCTATPSHTVSPQTLLLC